MKRLLAATATLVATPLLMVGSMGAAHAGEHGPGPGDCDPTRGVNFCPEPPPVPGPPVPQTFNLIFGSRFDDTLFGTHGDDAIFGRGGNDRLISNGGNDRLSGNRGDDTLIDNGPGFLGQIVTLRGGLGNDVCIGHTTDRFINCETVIVL
jgi:hypothetical protein